jgi:hypothetical protein
MNGWGGGMSESLGRDEKRMNRGLNKGMSQKLIGINGRDNREFNEAL